MSQRQIKDNNINRLILSLSLSLSVSVGCFAQEALHEQSSNTLVENQNKAINEGNNLVVEPNSSLSEENQSNPSDSTVSAQAQSILDDLDPEAAVASVPSEITLSDVKKAIDQASAISDFRYDDLFGSTGPNFEPAFEIVKTKITPNAMVKSEADTPSIYSAMDELLKSPTGLGNLSAEDKLAISQVYRARKGELIFVSDEKQEAVYKSAFEQVSLQGLPATRYEFGLLKPADPIPSLAMSEIEAAAFIIRYGMDMERGIVKPNDLGREYDLIPEGRSARSLLSDFANSLDKDKFMADLEPSDPDYAVLKAELVKLGVKPKDDHTIILAEVPETQVLRMGVNSKSVGLLRLRLAALESQKNNAKPSEDTNLQAILSDVEGSKTNPDLFDQGLKDAVIAYQTQMGLTADGVAGPTTLRYINGKETPRGGKKSILIAMERHRWAPQDRSGRQIFVNLPAFMAEVRDDNVKTFETRVVIGKNDPKYRTPEFHDQMENVVINPKWNVPNSIAVDEFLPRLKAGKRLGSTMQIVSRKTGKVVDPSTINFSKFTGKTFPYLIQQKSGDGNALGNVKFIFPNSHNIYLHDTPSKGLFANASRAYSHGCVRVGDPVDLATFLMAPYYSDPAASFRKIVGTKKETYVELKTKIPVFLTYFTTFVNDEGQIVHVRDVYGRDGALAKALEALGVAI